MAGAQSLRQGGPLEGDPTAVDAGAIALPGLVQSIAGLVEDAVAQGAKVPVQMLPAWLLMRVCFRILLRSA